MLAGPRLMGVKLACVGLVALVALVAACSAPAPPQAGAASPGAEHSPAAEKSPAAFTTPSPGWTLGLGPTAVSTVDFSCRLPVFNDQGHGASGVFIDFPSGKVTPDPAAAAVSLDHPGRELVGSFYVHYFDHANGQWLPVSRKDVSPDGTHYAYTDRAVADPQNPPTRATLHVVAVKTGAEQSFDDGPWADPYEILDFAAEGIYLITTTGRYIGLWLMDPTTGSLGRIASLMNVQGHTGDSAIWVGNVNPDDPHPIAGIAPNELDRISLPDGNRVAWFYRPANSVHMVGQDADGHPIVLTDLVFGPEEWLLLLSPGVSRPIWTGGNQVPSIGDPIADQHGVWFGSPDGIFLYSVAGGMQKVSNQPGEPATGCL